MGLLLGRFGLDIGHVDAAARRRIENAHQRTLRIAIANVKYLHVLTFGRWSFVVGRWPTD
jgi:hypothetical protein